MKKVFFISVMLMMAAACGNGRSDSAGSTEVKEEKTSFVEEGDLLPEFTLESEVYGRISSEDLKGDVSLLCFFATWCPSCQTELADVEKVLYPEFKDVEDFHLIVVGREHVDSELTEYNAKKHFSFALYPDPERKVYSLFADKTIPRSYLIDRSGKIIDASVGYDEKHFSELVGKIRSLLEKK